MTTLRELTRGPGPGNVFEVWLTCMPGSVLVFYLHHYILRYHLNTNISINAYVKYKKVHAYGDLQKIAGSFPILNVDPPQIDIG